MIKLKNGLVINVDPKKLAHCKMCNDPMYCIYDWTLRPYCWQCSIDLEITEDVPVFPPADIKSL